MAQVKKKTMEEDTEELKDKDTDDVKDEEVGSDFVCAACRNCQDNCHLGLFRKIFLSVTRKSQMRLQKMTSLLR